jgi:hypothetical protein
MNLYLYRQVGMERWGDSCQSVALSYVTDSAVDLELDGSIRRPIAGETLVVKKFTRG